MQIFIIFCNFTFFCNLCEKFSISQMKIPKIPNKSTFILIFVLFGIIITYIIGFLWIFNDSGYAFYHIDELTYYNSARMFAQTSSVKAPLCFMEAVSPIFQTHWYGINYHLLYGGIAKITGIHPFIFITLNAILLIIIAWIVLKIKTTINNHLIILIALLSAYPIALNCFNFFPEILMIFFGVVLSFYLYQMQKHFENRKKFCWYKIIFILLVLIFMTFRITTIFWLIALLPFSRNFKQFLFNILIGIAGFIITLLFMQYFTAPAFVLSLGLINKLKNLQIAIFFEGLWKNLKFNLGEFYNITIRTIPFLLYFILFCAVVISAIIYKKRILIAAIFIVIVYFIVLASLYNASFFYLSKQTAITLPIMIFAFVLFTEPNWAKLSLILGFVVGFVFANNTVIAEIYYRKLAFGEIKFVYNKEVEELQNIIKYFKPDKPPIVEILHYEHVIPYYIFYANMPVATAQKEPIIYTASIKSESLFPEIDYCERFPRYNKLPVSYILSADSLHCEDVNMLFGGKYFYFYEDLREE